MGKLKKVMASEIKRLCALEKPDASRVLFHARKRGVDCVTAAYCLGRCDAANLFEAHLSAYLYEFEHAQKINDAFNAVSKLTERDVTKVMRRYYDGTN